ncbi:MULTISPECIES: hypothetical protein [unclassified Actinomyces]|uniref:hypothetical protein n=1 Tax=unclassified Actinomyces TaxID=2609248 RepID=UPI002017F8C0|nr:MULTISPECIES: hypothetical protein [unclassified Actinomyces]MCL3776816.1 hypothetical protein [Actinomyces sp. AC-20-1]MCL3789725.1 hypothetical protein [Actinomyces sp. 187325]MCL3792082.1 hypothetical protein [Actinomyces sp. 186855]MCL3794739.1 hypothetical protein [Actinomyces sp. 217892]
MKTYRAATYLEPPGAVDIDTFCRLLEDVVRSASADSDHDVEVDEVAVMPSAGRVRLALAIKAGSVADASAQATRVLDGALNMLPDYREGVVRRHREISYV